jgi:hypothetical protein
MRTLAQFLRALISKRVAEYRRRKLARLIDQFQSNPSSSGARKQWKEIEKLIFGVDFENTL